jgi:archaellum component FlaC
MCNSHLEKLGHDGRIDHRSYKRQNKNQIPTIHLGTTAHQLEQRGIRTERGDINRAIEISNRKLQEIESRINDLQGWLTEEMELIKSEAASSENIIESSSTTQDKITTTVPNTPEPKPPTFADNIFFMLRRQCQKVVTWETADIIMDFLKSNDIKNYDGIELHLKNLFSEQRKLSGKLTPVRNRLNELNDLLIGYENYKELMDEYNKYNREYKALSLWKKKAYKEENGWILSAYPLKKSSMDKYRNEKGKIPIGSWQKEHATLTAELQGLDGEYQDLKNKVSTVDKFRTNVYDIIQKDKRLDEQHCEAVEHYQRREQQNNEPQKVQTQISQIPKRVQKKSRGLDWD